MGYHLCVVFVLILICHVSVSQVGNRCYMRNTRIAGICKISSDCPEVEEQARNGVDPTVCGYFQLTIPIVCCETNSFADGDFQSPSKPSDSFSNGDYNNNGAFVSKPQSSRPNPTSSSNIYFFNRPSTTSERNFPDRGDDSDSIVYPNEISSNNNYLRKSEAKCLEYTKPLNDVVQAIALVTDTEVVNINIEKCENNGVPLIVGGEPAAPGEFPFMAALGFIVEDEVEWRCGATLISEYFVVTAAHCTHTRDAGSPKIVRLGEIDLTKKNGRTHFDYSIDKIVAHPDYSYPQKYNDIALIKVKRKIKFSKYIRPACLYVHSNIVEELSIATGYGKEEYAASENKNKLMKVALHVLENDRCSRTFGGDRKSLPRGIISSMICAGELKGGKDTCQGDSGGPLVVTKKNNQCKFYLIGITSFGKSCGEVNAPAIYTRVSEYISWIENIVW
ncbi:hypothetical protein WA026_010373 [Henosepilachna vigintioctopunctata]|uniref:Uncharacterized protein n=1 Tax=Henosepilachna vigintioctopunctata TaxID=420089 RepID=A0AAW1VA22_9CUCU